MSSCRPSKASGTPCSPSSRQSRVPSTSMSGSPSGRGTGAGSVVEEKDRLELGARRTQQAKPPLERGRVSALVRQDDVVRVRLDPEGGDDPVSSPRDAVRADGVLLEKPHGRRLVADEHTVVEPAPESFRRGLLVRLRGQMHDVVRVASAEPRAVVRVDHVVWRRRHLCARPGVADGAERTDIGHRSSLQRPRLTSWGRSPTW